MVIEPNLPPRAYSLTWGQGAPRPWERGSSLAKQRQDTNLELKVNLFQEIQLKPNDTVSLIETCNVTTAANHFFIYINTTVTEKRLSQFYVLLRGKFANLQGHIRPPLPPVSLVKKNASFLVKCQFRMIIDSGGRGGFISYVTPTKIVLTKSVPLLVNYYFIDQHIPFPLMWRWSVLIYSQVLGKEGKGGDSFLVLICAETSKGKKFVICLTMW